MTIEVVLRETEDDFQVFSVEGDGLLSGDSSRTLQDLEVILDNGGSNQQLLLSMASHMLYSYPATYWTLKVERWDGYSYCLRFDSLTPVAPKPEPEVLRRSRYSREPVI